jgi:hypothetical protein
VPAPIARDFEEAIQSEAAGFMYGAALVGRRSLQAAAREVIGGKKGDLKTEIDQIPDDRLNKAMKEMAHEVRLIGNDAAHVDEITPDEVKELLGFTRLVLDSLYIQPARLAALRKVRQDKKAAPP